MLKSGAFRTESDSFGPGNVPADALYGLQTVRACDNLSFSGRPLSRYPLFIRGLAMVKKAAAMANREAGILDREIADMIAASCDLLIEGKHLEHFPVDVYAGGGGIGINMNVNEVIANLCSIRAGHPAGSGRPVHPIEHVNLSQSTSDVCHTAVRIAIIDTFEPLKKELDDLHAELGAKASAFAGVRTIARTCLQDAMAVSLGSLFSGYAGLTERRTAALARSVERLHRINLGGTVIGSGEGAHEAYRARILPKLREVTGRNLTWRENLYDAAQNPDDLAEVSASLAQLASALLKIAADLRLLSSGPEAGFAELKLPAVQAGSSFFPGKVNPVVPETLMHCCFLIFGLHRSVEAALEHGELNLNVWETTAGINLLEALAMLTGAVRSFTRNCLRGLEANVKRCEQFAESLVPLVTHLKESYGYSRLAGWIREAERAGVDFKTWARNNIGTGVDRNGTGPT